MKFEFRGDELIYTEYIKLFNEFNILYNHNSRKEEQEINKAFRYISYMCDIDSSNPFADEKKNRKHAEVMFRLFNDREAKFTWRLEAKLTDALNLYVKLNSEPEEFLLQVLEEKKTEIKQLLEESEPEVVSYIDRDGATKYDTNITLLTQALQAIVDVDTRRKTIIASIKNEAMSNKVRGQVFISPLASGSLKIPDTDK